MFVQVFYFLFCLLPICSNVGLLKSPTIVFELPISPFICFCWFLIHVFWGSYICVYMFILYMKSSWCFSTIKCPLLLVTIFILKSVLSDIKISHSSCLFVNVCMVYIFFHPFIFSIFVSLNLKCMSCRSIQLDRSPSTFYFS